MKKTILGIFGLLVLLFSLYIANSVKNAELQASRLNNKKTSHGMVDDSIPLCAWEVQPPEKVMTEDKSQAIKIKTGNNTEKQCETYISLRAPGFDISPSKEEQKVTIPPKNNGSISWILTPEKTGTFEVAVSDGLNTEIFGVSVTNIFGLNALHAKILSWIGGLFGPMLTIPWWWDRVRGRKQKNDTPKNDEANKL